MSDNPTTPDSSAPEMGTFDEEGYLFVEGRIDATYFKRRNQLVEENRDMLDHQPALETEIARLKALPGIAERHEESVAAHRARIKALKATPLYEQLLRMTEGVDAALGGTDALVYPALEKEDALSNAI